MTPTLNLNRYNKSFINADVDLSNLTDEGQNKISNLAMPSATYTDLTLGSSGTVYIAPADGWFYIRKATGNANLYLFIAEVNSGGNTIRNDEIWSTASQSLGITFPTRKGALILIAYTFTGSTAYFRFIYAQGAVSEA